MTTTGRLDTSHDCLAVIDMQRVFAEPSSPWAAPGFAGIVAAVQRLVDAFADRVVLTRFVAPDQPVGAWQDYYAAWPFALQPEDAALYQLVEELRSLGRPTLDASTFGKWTPELARSVPPGGRLVVCGVSTDCCVLSTVLAAADAGTAVLVVEDACAGADDSSHRRALEAMALYEPLVRIVTTADLLTVPAAG